MDSYFSIALQLLSLIVLARLISPAEFGVFSVASVAVGIGQSMREFGVGSYLIQEKALTDHKVRTAFTITLGIAAILFVVAEAAAGAIATFYSDPRVEVAFRLLAINFLLMPFTSITISLMRRQFNFDKLFLTNVASGIAGTSTAISLASVGFGYLSLVWASIVSALVFCIGGTLWSRQRLWLKPSLVEWRGVLSFGSRVTFTNVLTQIAININDLVAGRVLGLSSLALLNRAQSIMNLFHRDVMGALQSVAYPVFARANREGRDVDEVHTRSVTAITAMAWPFYGFMALYPQEILRLLFGTQWDAAAPYVPYYCLAGAIAATWNLVSQLLTAIGRVDLATQAEMVIQPARIGTICLCALLFDNGMAFVLALVFIYAAHWPVVYFQKRRAMTTDWLRYMNGLLASAKLTVVALSLPVLIKILMPYGIVPISGATLLPVLAFMTLVSWVVGLRVLGHPLLHDPLVPDWVRRHLSGN